MVVVPTVVDGGSEGGGGGGVVVAVAVVAVVVVAVGGRGRGGGDGGGCADWGDVFVPFEVAVVVVLEPNMKGLFVSSIFLLRERREEITGNREKEKKVGV